MEFIPNQSKLEFDEPSHTYTFEGQELTSVSRVIHSYSQKFDEDGVIAARCAAKNGITIEEQRDEWKKINADSIVRGHSFHSDLETYIKTKKIPNTSNKEVIKQFSKIKFKGKLYSEVRLFNVEFGIAGTSDILEVLPDGSINIWDLKSNKAIKTFSFGRKMQYPLHRIWDANAYHYSIQLETYKFMLEEAGWWVRDLTLLHIDPTNDKLKHIPVEPCRQDVIRMLTHFRENYGKNDLPKS